MMARMNRDALVEAARGGGARLTSLGREALARYRTMEAKAPACVADDLAEFRELLDEGNEG